MGVVSGVKNNSPVLFVNKDKGLLDFTPVKDEKSRKIANSGFEGENNNKKQQKGKKKNSPPKTKWVVL